MHKGKARSYLLPLAEQVEKLFRGENIEQYAALCYRCSLDTNGTEVLLISAHGPLDAHSSFCSRRNAPTSLTKASSLGRMPAASVRRLISPLRATQVVEL